MEQPQTRYARSGNAYIAYQGVGDGPFDLVWAQSAFQNVEHRWESTHRADVTRKLDHSRDLGAVA